MNISLNAPGTKSFIDDIFNLKYNMLNSNDC